MSTLDTIVATLPGSQLSLAGLLKGLRRQGRLGHLVLEALTEQLVLDEARRAGLSVTQEELQEAANSFRSRRNLITAADTQDWLLARGMSMDDFQANLQHELLTIKLRQHLTAARIEGHFTAHRAGYERFRLAELCLGRDDLANELASQVREDGRDLATVADEHRVRLVRGESFRKDLANPVVAALATAEPGQLIGPVVTPEGFLLVLVEARQLPTLDPDTRQQIEDDLFSAWLAERTRAAKIDLALPGTC